GAAAGAGGGWGGGGGQAGVGRGAEVVVGGEVEQFAPAEPDAHPLAGLQASPRAVQAAAAAVVQVVVGPGEGGHDDAVTCTLSGSVVGAGVQLRPGPGRRWTSAPTGERRTPYQTPLRLGLQRMTRTSRADSTAKAVCRTGAGRSGFSGAAGPWFRTCGGAFSGSRWAAQGTAPTHRTSGTT